MPCVTCGVTLLPMIKTFAHKGLEKFYATGSQAGIQAVHAKRLRLILALLDEARTVETT